MYKSTFNLIQKGYNSKALLFNILSQNTDWGLLMANRNEFNFPGGIVNVPEIKTIGNYKFSSYRCPRCGKALYKTTFPEGIDPQFVFNDETGSYVQAARVFTCPDCLMFFAVQEGQHLNDADSTIVSAQFDQNDHGLAMYNDWFILFNDLGDLNAKRQV